MADHPGKGRSRTSESEATRRSAVTRQSGKDRSSDPGQKGPLSATLDPAVLENIRRAAMPSLDPAMLENIRRAMLPQLEPALLEAAFATASLSKQRTFDAHPDDETTFSPQLVRPAQLFEGTESVVQNVDDLTKAVDRIQRKNPGLNLVWRGQQNADWGLHSSLHRSLMRQLSVDLPWGDPVGASQELPAENHMVAAERELFEVLRQSWRMDHLPGLELLARLQHHGGPTRLLDVTRNPLMALWFATEGNEKTDDFDARLFAIATNPPIPDGSAPQPVPLMNSAMPFQSAQPFWLDADSDEDRRRLEWGTGTMKRVWIPPAYDDRIAAQNAAFLIDGLPLPSKEILDTISAASESGVAWRWADLAAAASFYFSPARSTRKVAPHRHRLAPVFSFRVPAAAKARLWEGLVNSYGLKPGVVYPDVEGLAAHLRARVDWLERATQGR